MEPKFHLQFFKELKFHELKFLTKIQFLENRISKQKHFSR